MEKLKSEDKIQQECVMWFRNTYGLNHHNPKLLMFSVPNSGQNAKEQLKKKAVGLLPGVADTIIVLPNKTIYCEFKDEKGIQSPAQIKFEQDIIALGHEYWVIRSLEEFKQKTSKGSEFIEIELY